MKKILVLTVALFLALSIFANIKFHQYSRQTQVLKTMSHENDAQIEQVWRKIGALEPQLITELNAANLSKASSQRQYDSNDTLKKISGLTMVGSLLLFALASLVLSITIRNSDE